MSESAGKSQSAAAGGEAEFETAGGWDSAQPAQPPRQKLAFFETDYDKILRWDAFTRVAKFAAAAAWLPTVVVAAGYFLAALFNDGEFNPWGFLIAVVVLWVNLGERPMGALRVLMVLLNFGQVSSGLDWYHHPTGIPPAAGILVAVGGLWGGAANVLVLLCNSRIRRLKLPARLRTLMGSPFKRRKVGAAVEDLRREQESDGAEWGDGGKQGADER